MKLAFRLVCAPLKWAAPKSGPKSREETPKEGCGHRWPHSKGRFWRQRDKRH